MVHVSQELERPLRLLVVVGIGTGVSDYMKVCFADYDIPTLISGVSTWVQRLLPLLKMPGIELEAHVAVAGGKPGAKCAFFKEQGVPVRWMPMVTHLPSAVRSWLRSIEEGQPDIYVPNSSISALYAAGYARRAGIPTVGALHSDDPYYWGIVDQFINGDPDFRVSAVVPVSTFLESRVSATATANGVMVHRIGYGVPIPPKTAEPPGSVFRLVYVGRLVEEQKRISDVANALCAVTQNIPKLEAWVVGEGEARPTVEAIIQEKGLGDRVRLLGRVDNARIYEVLAECHGLVLLSDYEGLPVAMLEGMATGVVPICLDTQSGIREAIEHGVNGFIVKDRAADFIATIKGLQSDPKKWRQLSLAARETVRQRYSIDECARQWVELLKHLNSRPAPRTNFRAPRLLRLPPPDPRFYASPPWQRKLAKYIQPIPPLYRMAKATVAVGRKVKSEAMMHRYSRKRRTLR